jgi:TonB family protein
MVMQMRRFLMIGLLAIVTGPVVTSSGLAAEQDTARKATRKVAPLYPEAAHRLQLAGTVRLLAVVAAEGHVTDMKFIGGHPLLVAAVRAAVKQWKFEPAARESREPLVFAFAVQ